MGAHNIEFEIGKKATTKQIEQAFKQRQKHDKEYNGHREGYSGDFQTVHAVDHHLNKVFDDYNQAHDYCLKHATKWATVVSVYYLKEKPKDNKTLERLKLKKAEIEQKIKDEERKLLDKAKTINKNLGTLVAGWGAC